MTNSRGQRIQTLQQQRRTVNWTPQESFKWLFSCESKTVTFLPMRTDLSLNIGQMFSIFLWVSAEVQDGKVLWGSWCWCYHHQSKRGEHEIVPLFTDRLGLQEGDVIRRHLQRCAPACRAALVFGVCLPGHIRMRLSYLLKRSPWRGRQLWAVNRGDPQWNGMSNQPQSATGWFWYWGPTLRTHSARCVSNAFTGMSPFFSTPQPRRKHTYTTNMYWHVQYSLSTCFNSLSISSVDVRL